MGDLIPYKRLYDKRQEKKREHYFKAFDFGEFYDAWERSGNPIVIDSPPLTLQKLEQAYADMMARADTEQSPPFCPFCFALDFRCDCLRKRMYPPLRTASLEDELDASSLSWEPEDEPYIDPDDHDGVHDWRRDD